MSWVSPIQILGLLPVFRKPVVGKVRRRYPRGGKPSKAETKALHEKILELKGQGYARFEIAEILGVSRATVGKHINGKILGT